MWRLTPTERYQQAIIKQMSSVLLTGSTPMLLVKPNGEFEPKVKWVSDEAKNIYDGWGKILGVVNEEIATERYHAVEREARQRENG